MRHARRTLGQGATLIIGIDLVKDPAILNAAYNDAAGVTAQASTSTCCARINREFGGNFDPAAFCHQAFFNIERRRIEMHLASRKRQKVTGRGPQFRVPRRRDDPHREQLQIHAWTPSAAMARGCGWTPIAAWTDPQGYFSVQALTAAN